MLYTTNSIESLNAQLRKATRNRGQFPNDTAALKTLWLMICNIEDKRAAQRAKKAKRNIECNGYIEGAKATGWKQAINQLAVAFPRPIRGLLVNQAPAHKETDTLSADSIALILALSASTTSCCTSHSGLSPFTGWKPTHNP